MAYLKKQPGFSDLWADLDENSLHRGDIEKLLLHTVHQNFAKLYRFANPEQRTFMKLYFKRYEIAIMKDCLRKVFCIPPASISFPFTTNLHLANL